MSGAGGAANQWRPRLVRGANGGAYFIHPCSICGDPVAPFGYGARLRSGEPGEWRCAKHKKERPNAKHA